jgi:hypothetical protein
MHTLPEETYRATTDKTARREEGTRVGLIGVLLALERYDPSAPGRF